ncbi:MAG: LuxR C-terminal-related transcriptional regulator [Anaerolineales bacterium]
MVTQPPVGAAEMPILRTKLYIPPPRPELVSRPRLVERLNAGLHRKLTLISAPAGFGKTTLVSEWVHTMGRVSPPIAGAPGPPTTCPGAQDGYACGPSAPSRHRLGSPGAGAGRTGWLSLDEDDNDPTRFLAYLIAALRTIEASIGKGVLSALQSPQPPPAEAVLISLINEIAAIQLTELRGTDLRFTSSEAAEFLNRVMGLDLSAEDIAVLERRTEGWIAGLQLAAISMQGHKDVTGFIQSFTGSHRYVLDYLVQEVLEQQSERVQTFLLQTAVLDRLTGSLCDAVRFGTAETPSTAKGTANDGQATLEMLERANLFIVPLDDERRWYRYHHLFADLLRRRLTQTQPEQLPVLHGSASKWYEQNGLIDEAIEHALRANEFERTAHLIESVADAVWARGGNIKLRRWLDGLPVELVLSKPQLCIFRAWELFASGRQDAAERFLQAAGLGYDSSTDRATETESLQRDQPPGSSRLGVRGRAAAIQAWMATYRRHNIPGLIQHLRQALEYLPERDLNWRSAAATTLGDVHAFRGDMLAAYQARLEALKACEAAGNTYLFMYNSAKLALNLKAQGRLLQVRELCQQQVGFANESGMSQTAVVGWLLAIWGEALAEINDLDGALDLVEKGMKLSESGGDVVMLGWSCLCLTRVLFSKGDMAGAEEIVQKMDKVARESLVPTWIMNLNAAWQSRIWLAQDKLEAAAQWVRERGLELDKAPTHVSAFEYIAFARILIAQGRWDETTKLLQRMLEAAKVGGNTTRVIEIMMLQALAFQSGGDTTRAMDALERALTLAEPEGFIRIFVDEGPPMARLLYEAVSRGIAPEYARRLLAAFPMPEPEQDGRPDTQAPESDLIEPLSERELEVLQLIAEGLTNPEIASRLFLSLHTVKAPDGSGHQGKGFGGFALHLVPLLKSF